MGVLILEEGWGGVKKPWLVCRVKRVNRKDLFGKRGSAI